MFLIKLYLCFIILIQVSEIQSQTGPDPWDYDSKTPRIRDEVNIPPDLKLVVKRKPQTENKPGIVEFSFKRILKIVLMSGQIKRDEDGSVDISLQMKFDRQQWEILNESLKSDTPLTEDMLRRIMGYVQEAIYKPTIVEKISMAWSDYIEAYLTEYKTHITWTLGFLAAGAALHWLWSRMSHKHLIFIVFLIFYAYEGVISYKEAEKKEMELFLSAVNSCKWYFWTPSCTVPSPDPLVFLKHMNPLKVLARMVTTALAEPIVAFNETIGVILHNLTDGIMYPFNKIIYAVFAVFINISLIYFFIMILFNWLLNIPFHIGFGLFGVSLGQRQRNWFTNNNAANIEPPRHLETERISQATVDKILNVCSLALSGNAQNVSNLNPVLPQSSRTAIQNTPMLRSSNIPKSRRSASTGRLPNTKSYENNVAYNLRHDGSGDAW